MAQQETNSNNFEALRFGVRDAIWFATIAIGAATNILSTTSQMRELTAKFEDYRQHQEEMTVKVQQLYDLRFSTLELRLLKLENQAEKQKGR